MLINNLLAVRNENTLRKNYAERSGISWCDKHLPNVMRQKVLFNLKIILMCCNYLKRPETIAKEKEKKGKKKICRARADLRNYSTGDDEIVPVRTHRDSRQALTAMTYDLESLVLLTTPSPAQPTLHRRI
ncbi:hypothetical protein PUN28_004877 [Cardiocondyla obscurior]|uniref:Uncharacterized protein n=1 Tax=Cardiocondyla obscurior TaxID=286306 RepID=A0AAW2GEN5_9HYME